MSRIPDSGTFMAKYSAIHEVVGIYYCSVKVGPKVSSYWRLTMARFKLSSRPYQKIIFYFTA